MKKPLHEPHSFRTAMIQMTKVLQIKAILTILRFIYTQSER